VKKSNKKPSQYGLNLFVSEGNRKPPAQCDVVTIGKGKEIYFNPDILNTYRYDGWANIHHDLLIICAAIECADRQRARRQACWSRHLVITVPVIELNKWQSPEVQQRLCDVLRHLTGDEWHFNFLKASDSKDRYSQGVLPFPKDNLQYTLAYSDGLDSRCVSGLYKDDEIVRVRISGKKDRAEKGAKQPFDLIPFNVKPARSSEGSVRSRGFKFAAITAIASHLAGVTRIIVPESGQGGLGPVLVPLHNIYPDYRNHPTFFRKMEKFIEALLEHPVSYEQPRLWNTKGETIAAYMQTGPSEDSLHSTRSCWQQRHGVRFAGKLWQCGLCAACLLRRMSMHAVGVTENNTYAIDDLSAARLEGAMPKLNSYHMPKVMIEYGSVGARHLQHLADMADLPAAKLKVHAFDIAQNTGKTEEETLGNLRRLVTQHADEWHSFVKDLGNNSFIKSWIEGGRYD
jgi:Queuosine biosynthesis protein QueC